jgi:hypothetical protein
MSEAPARPPRHVLGLDLGQAADSSALCALSQTAEPAPGGGRPALHYAAVGQRRWDLGTSYVAVVADVNRLLQDVPALRGAPLVVDAGGCGRPVVDLIKAQRLPCRLVPAVITAGLAESRDEAGYWHVAKAVLISGTQVVLQQRRLKLPRGLPETDALVRELENYRVKITPAANETWSARSGEHDDRVLALALAVWWGERSPPPASLGKQPREGQSVGEQLRARGAFLTGEGPAWWQQ